MFIWGCRSELSQQSHVNERKLVTAKRNEPVDSPIRCEKLITRKVLCFLSRNSKRSTRYSMHSTRTSILESFEDRWSRIESRSSSFEGLSTYICTVLYIHAWILFWFGPLGPIRVGSSRFPSKMFIILMVAYHFLWEVVLLLSSSLTCLFLFLQRYLVRSLTSLVI